jgi:chromosome segregation protein
VLADRAGALVVQDANGGLTALDSLRRSGRGRGVFVTLPALESHPAGFVPLGRPLLDRVKAHHGYEGLARALFGHVNLVDSLDEVVRVYGRGSLPATFVTRDGDLLSPDGTLRGGGVGEGGGQIARVGEIRELERETEALELRVATGQEELAAAERELARATDELENLRNRHHTAALAVANHEKDLERTRERVKALGEVHEGRVAERTELLAEFESLGSERERLAGLLEAARSDRALRQRALDALGLRIGSAGREAQRLEVIATERRVEHAGRAERRAGVEQARARLEASLSETHDWIERREQEIRAAERRREELATEIGEAELRLTEKLREEDAARASHDARREAFETASAALQALEERARELRAEISRQREEIAGVELSLRESELELTHLDTSMREKWDVELASWQAPLAEPEPEIAAEAQPESAVPAGEGVEAAAALGEPAAASGEEDEPAPDAAREARRNAELARLPLAGRRRELEEQRRRLSALGEVNLGAIEEHEELQERFRFLSEQKADLDGTLAQLREAIARINRTSRKRFRDTFEEVSKRFSENFPRLFRGGKASLSLTETEDVLEAGIEIMAQPPGKRLQNVNLLSGGEKTMTAIALLVAVFQVRPAPFFLLDEVDAALDDANVGRFNEMVVELAKDSQFVMITHNKRTIEIADVLYGVTMERRGVSKLVSVELSPAPVAAG